MEGTYLGNLNTKRALPAGRGRRGLVRIMGSYVKLAGVAKSLSGWRFRKTRPVMEAQNADIRPEWQDFRQLRGSGRHGSARLDHPPTEPANPPGAPGPQAPPIVNPHGVAPKRF